MLANGIGTVYGCLVNFRGALAELGESVHQPPLKAPPRSPVLYIKPRNTHAADGAVLRLPAGAELIEVGATFAAVIGRTATRVAEADALGHVAGWVAVNDASLPHRPYYRPSLRFKCRDGYCPIGTPVPREALDPADTDVVVEVDGREVQRGNTNDLVRPVARLIADVTEFMTLVPGDLLMVGVPAGAPLLRAGQRCTLRIGNLPPLRNTVEAA